jgi:hypothetical protein
MKDNMKGEGDFEISRKDGVRSAGVSRLVLN